MPSDTNINFEPLIMNKLDQSRTIIIGTCTAQDQALARFLEEKIGVSCLISESFKDYVVNKPVGDSGPTLFLYDCFRKGRENLVDFLHRYLETASSDRQLIMFNLPSEGGIEKEALYHGANGFLYEQDSLETFVKAIKAVFCGEAWISRKKMAECFSPNHNSENNNHNLAELTRREIQILKLLIKGHSNQMIADELYISPHTVKTHLTHIFAKIKVQNRRQAKSWADIHL